MLRSYIAILLMFLCSNIIGAQSVSKYVFRPIGISQGLPDNYVKTVFGLPDGRLGVRTTILLSLYDGYNFKNHSLLMGEVYPLNRIPLLPTQYIDNFNRLWIKESNKLQVFDLNTESFLSPTDIFNSLGVNVPISDFFIDAEGTMWIIDNENSLSYYDYKAKCFHKVYASSDFYEKNGPLMDLETNNGLTWIVYANGIVRCYDMLQDKIVRHENFLGGKIDSNDNVKIKFLENGDFWLLYSKGLSYYNNSTKIWSDIDLSILGNYQELVTMDTDLSGNAWIASVRKGLFIVDRFSHKIDSKPVLSYNNSNENIHGVYIDKITNITWVGTFNRGLAYFHPSMVNFKVYNSNTVNDKWINSDLRCMLELSDNTLLFGTDDGLVVYDTELNSVSKPYKITNGILCKSMIRDKNNNIWLGTYKDGLFCINPNDVYNIKHILLKERKEYETNGIRCLALDKDGEIWVSTHGGVGRYNSLDNSLEMLPDRYPELKKYRLANCMIVSRSDKLVVGADNGLYFYDISNDSVIIPQYRDVDNSGVLLGNNKYNCILEDSREMLWLGTQYGLIVLNRRGEMYYLGEEDGLDNATVQSIQEDDNHDIWISTIGSIYKITVNHIDEGVTDFKIVCLEWSKRKYYSDLYEFCSLKTKGGELIFGRLDGFCKFVPENVVLTSCKSAPFFTNFRILGEAVNCGEEYNGRILFGETINNTRNVELEYDENFITIDFSSLNFLQPSQTHFRYKLDGVDKQWNELVSSNSTGSVNYNHLLSGDYIFRVQSAGNDYVWSPESVFKIRINPPLWLSMPAFIIYTILLVLLVYTVFIYIKRKNHLKLIRIQEKESLRQKEEINQMKFRFFTNISHELRTPLTLIMTPLEVLMQKENDEKKVKHLNVIYKNATDLYNLVNQLLDFRKVEMRMEKLHLTSGDIRDFIASIYTCFTPFAEEKHLEFEIENLSESTNMYFDHDKVHKILNNLLSNAFKFTAEGGRVLLKVKENIIGGRHLLSISVQDTGIGMSEDDLNHIFERFYQASNNNADGTIGSGIGLHLVREYVKLHHGEIEVESKLNKGSIFRLLIPMDLKPEEDSDIKENIKRIDNDDNLEPKGLKQKILIVEDNNDMRAFLAEQLEDFYTVFTASDGDEGYNLALEHNPSLIVSDIMMPKMNGIELCRKIKTNVQTSHIPVILLSARTADNVKISGYEVGADSYISKPFNFELLLVRIKKLIEQQEERRKEFKKNLSVDPSAITITSLDESLVKKALEFIEKNMDNTSYSVENLSTDMGMSRMNLYRKIQSITGQTPTEFIRTIRLKRAAQLLSGGSKLSMAEVADMVGFSSSSYFTKCFKDQFGILPTQYAIEHSN